MVTASSLVHMTLFLLRNFRSNPFEGGVALRKAEVGLGGMRGAAVAANRKGPGEEERQQSNPRMN